MIHILKICARILFLCAITIAYAEEYTYKQALEQYSAIGIKIPALEDDGRVQTLNKKGAMSPYMDEATIKFIEFAKNKKALEVGGAYGKVMIEALKKHPNTLYTLNDLDRRHLFIAANEAKTQNLPNATLQNIRFISSDISSDFKTSSKYDAMLVARVLHFFSPKQMRSAVDNMFNALHPGGRVYVVAVTPYLKRYESFIPEYEKRLAKDEAYPGYVKSLKDWANKVLTTPSQMAVIAEEPFMFLDDKVLPRVFKESGFKIIECKTTDLGYHSSVWSLDGRENVILIAEKSGVR